MGIEETQAFGFVAKALPYEFGEPFEVGEGHAGFPELHADLQPVHVGGDVLAPAARRAVDGPDQ